MLSRPRIGRRKPAGPLHETRPAEDGLCLPAGLRQRTLPALPDFFLRASFINSKIAAIELLAVEGAYRSLAFCIAAHGHKSEAAGSTGRRTWKEGPTSTRSIL